MTETVEYSRIYKEDLALGTGTASVRLADGALATLTEIQLSDFETSFTAGSIIFSNGTVLAQDNSNLHWDDTNNRLGIGTASPDEPVHVAEATDGDSVLLLVENSQAHAGGSTNETAQIRFGFGGDNDVGRIVAGKDNDYGVDADKDSKLSLYVDVGGAATERLKLDSAGVADLLGNTAGDAILKLSADQAGDNADQWRLRVQDGGVLTLETFASSSWVIVSQWSTAGENTRVLQPAFQAKPASAQTNFAIDTDVTVVFGTEIFDQGGDFASNTFTAPVTGRYALTAWVTIASVDTAATNYILQIVTSNRTYSCYLASASFVSDLADQTLSLTVLADMDSSDTAHVVIHQTGGAAQSDIQTVSYFSGWLAA